MNAATGGDWVVVAEGDGVLPVDVGHGSTVADDVLDDGDAGVLAMAGGWLGEAERSLATGDHEGAAGSLAYAVEALDALTVEAEEGTPQTGLATRLLACYRALMATGMGELAPVPAFVATG